jgi:hypothetical protein
VSLAENDSQDPRDCNSPSLGGVARRRSRPDPDETRQRSDCDPRLPEFADFLLSIAVHYTAADTIHLVMDNLSTHTRKALVNRLGEKAGGWLWGRFTIHYTPKHGSWLDQAEIEISLFSRQCLGKRRIPDLPTLTREARAWNRRVNRNHIKINWKFTRKKARNKFAYKRPFSRRSKT